MEKPINFNIEKISKAIKELVRSRAIQYGSLIAYEENGNIVKEDLAHVKRLSFKVLGRNK
jgi:hypothetical protein